MSNDKEETPPEMLDIATKLELETAKLGWDELQRHFARGVVIVVKEHLDLIEVAIKLTEDDNIQFEKWTKNDQIWRANDEDAIAWQETQPTFWSVVVAPWVLVQEVSAKTD